MASMSELPDGSKLNFEILNSLESNATGIRTRLGRLSIPGRRPLETPNFIAISSRGVIPHMTPDIIASHTQINGVHMAIEDYIEKTIQSAPPVLSCTGASPLHTFTSLPSSIITVLAPRRTPAVAAPNGNTDTAISLFTSTGFQILTNTAYIDCINTLKPDIAISLADISYGNTPGTKRLLKMGDRTQSWMSSLLSSEPTTSIFAPILPIDSLSQSEYLNYLADETADDISGLAFYDSNLLPDIPATTLLSRLPRLSINEPVGPQQILIQISLGMDIFTIPFIGSATDAGITLSFQFPRPTQVNESVTKEGSNILPLGIDMWPTQHSKSVLPLSPNCSCYTCTSHHRAYIQHLLSAKEMLGWVLLQIHNHHIVSEFFTSIRQSIERGSFEKDAEEFAKVYESELPERSGQGPRIRGYHFRSEGPGEAKRNKSAWGNLNNGKDNEVLGDGEVVQGSADVLSENGFADVVVE
ncbi:hypothetical protein B7494_g7702 [Chlorociboria aeruginascens]|nr:hypothetical protein B7494_g7702 [Chlorociboria aeruginascens]